MDISRQESDSRKAVDVFIKTAEAARSHWTTPRAPGKWSPSQVAEHVAISFDQVAHMIKGEPHGFPKVPFFLRPVARVLLLNRTIRGTKFPRARTFKDFDPPAGPDSPEAARERLLAAHQRYLDACHARASADGTMFSSVFGTVPIEAYMRFMTMHTAHHEKQMEADG